MTARILVSPAATGKTRRNLERVLELLTEQPLAAARIVLPDSFQVASFRRQLAAAGGAFGVQVGTFGTLYHELLRKAGHPIPVASDALTLRLIRASIEKVKGRDELQHFGGIAGTPGFLQVLQDRFAELKRAQVYPETFIAYAQKQTQALKEIATLYQSYQEQLNEIGWVDPAGLNWLAVGALEADPKLASEWPIVVIDGFGAFVPSQLTAIRLMSERVQEMWITLPGSAESSRTAFRRFRRELDLLLEAIPEAEIVSLEGEPRLPSSISHVESGLFEASPQKLAGDDSLSMQEARTPIEESREALRWIKSKHLRDDVPLEVCAIVTPDPVRYRRLLEQAAGEMGIPIRFSQRESLASAPSVAALLDLLNLQLQGWPRRQTIEAVRNPFFDLASYRLHPESSAQLEAVSQVGQVIEGLDQWGEALDRLARSSPVEDAIDEDLRFAAVPQGSAAADLQRGLEALDERLRPPNPRSTMAWVRWLEDLLQELSYPGEMSSPNENAAQASLREVLRALVQAEAVAGARDKPYEAFLGELRAGIEGSGFAERINWREPHVLVLSLLEARGLRFDAVAVMGLSEGLFPEIEREDPFFDETTRKGLNLEPKLNREQAGLFYQAVTRADRFLLLTRPYLADDGEAWEPSPFWDAVKSMLETDPLRISPEQPRPLPDAASVQDVLFWGVRREKLPKIYLQDLGGRWEQLRHARNVLQAREIDNPQDRNEGSLAEITEPLRSQFGDDRPWSASRLESYATCPFSFFVANGLEIEPREPPELGYDAAQLGSILHAILEVTYQSASDPTDLESLRDSLHQAMEDIFAEAPERYGFRPTPLWDIEQDALRQSLLATLEALESDKDDWVPLEFELRFGFDDDPIMLEQGSQRIYMRGVIDRVDHDGQGELRVMDYKTGSSHLSPRDLVEGRRLQIPLYAFAAEQLGLGKPVEGMYWAILRGARSSLRLSNFQFDEFQGPEGAVALAKEHAFRIVRSIGEGAFAPKAPSGGCPAYCPAAAWCWRYSEGWRPS